VRNPEHVYIFWAPGRGVTKIGVAVDPEKRAAGFRRTNRLVTDLQIIETWHRPLDARAVEAVALRLMQPYRCVGEWFEAGHAAAERAVRRAVRLSDAGRAKPLLRLMADYRKSLRKGVTVAEMAEKYGVTTQTIYSRYPGPVLAKLRDQT